jgi:uncharacterized membrane protein (TIGR01666 family)
MNKSIKEVRNFFYSQAFADGLRTTAAILLPSLILSYFNLFEVGLTISLGATCVSMTDAPGPLTHKRNGMLYCSLFIFITAIITAWARMNVYTLGLEIFLASFLFSMFAVYGVRASSVGSASMLVLILSMDRSVEGWQVIVDGTLIFAGGLWYMMISIFFYRIRPYRPAQRALGECIREIAAYLSIKADFYSTATDLEEDYRKLLAQQIVVSEKLEAVRELFFKTRQIIKESSFNGRKLVLALVEAVDLFEDITAAYYDYASLRKKFGHTGILDAISLEAKRLAVQLDDIGIAIQSNADYIKNEDFYTALQKIKTEIDAVGKTDGISNLVLKKLLVNLRNLQQRVSDIQHYFSKEAPARRTTANRELKRFVTHQSFDGKLFWGNLSMKSSIFRHSLRVCIACIAGFAIAEIVAYGDYSYWIVLTVAFILKPAYGLTKQRNYQRIIGTVAGGLLGVLILIFIPDKKWQFIFLVLFMLGNYSFQRINYLVMVICITPFVFILFSFLGVGILEVAPERILDTIIGCALAFAASYFLFPNWESDGLKNFLHQMLKANKAYFEKLVEGLQGNSIRTVDYKLARKEVYVSSANLSAAFQRMLSEPKSKQKASKQVQQFVVLNHIFLFNIATLASTIVGKEVKTYPSSIIHSAKKVMAILNQCLRRFDEEEEQILLLNKTREASEPDGGENLLLKEQLDFIFRLTQDIDKTTKAILAE